MHDPSFLIPTFLPSPATGCDDSLVNPPRMGRNVSGAMSISLAYVDEQGNAKTNENDPPQLVGEVVLLRRRGWVIVDAEVDVFVMTEAEYNEQVRSAMVPKPML